jgi:sulfatase maturation enzyme AslB (radical SAM superfamily)
MDIIYIITYKCNLNCTYCPVFKNNFSLSLKIIDSSLNLLDNKIEKIRLFGGEPLLEYKTIKYLVDKIRKKNKKIKIFLTTNAILLDKDKLKWLKKNKINLTVSLDGNEFTQLKNRKGHNSYKKIINLLKELPQETVFNLVIAPNTVKYFDYNFKFLIKLGITRFNILPAYYNNWKVVQIKLLEKKLDDVLAYIKENSLKNKIFLQNLENFSDLSFFNQAILIDCDGKIYNSTVILAKQFVKHKKLFQIGDLNEHDFKIKYKKIKQKQVDDISPKDLVLINKKLDNILNNFIVKYKQI